MKIVFINSSQNFYVKSGKLQLLHKNMLGCILYFAYLCDFFITDINPILKLTFK